MNICTPGNCICDAAEWPGDTNCMGEVVGVDPWQEASEGLKNWNPRYYFDQTYGVVLSVQADEMKAGVDYYMDPDLRTRST
jgi:hypothetical protein